MKHCLEVERGDWRHLVGSLLSHASHTFSQVPPTPYSSQRSSPSDVLADTFFHCLVHFPAQCHVLSAEHCPAPLLFLDPLCDLATMNEERRGTTSLLLLT